jgi:membrane protein implicated in regulation of membrane protease activity
MDRTGLVLVRIALPATIAVAGAALLLLGDSVAQGAGIVLLGVAALVVLANALMRLSLLSERDREREQERRRAFSRRGRWPHERPR